MYLYLNVSKLMIHVVPDFYVLVSVDTTLRNFTCHQYLDFYFLLTRFVEANLTAPSELKESEFRDPCPPELEYFRHVDQLVVRQVKELIESKIVDVQ